MSHDGMEFIATWRSCSQHYQRYEIPMLVTVVLTMSGGRQRRRLGFPHLCTVVTVCVCWTRFGTETIESRHEAAYQDIPLTISKHQDFTIST
jgi:hypothetical protein